ncbi:MAG: response regulator [Acidobacteria bacterium]|nr:response regulator [Acidobacteriota bacterium]
MVQRKPIILCVDDEANPLLLRKLVLEKLGFIVVTAASAAEALKIFNSIKIDLILSDQLMPGVTGTQLARQVKALCPGFPVVIVSGVNQAPADCEDADLFISKLEGPAAVSEKIYSLLGITPGQA